MEVKIVLGFLLFLSCGTLISAVDRGGFPELCPCLPIKLCPRIYGASPEDRKYLGEFLKCTKEDEVRCCGVSVVSSDSSSGDKEDKSSSEEVVKHLVHNEIEDVRMEHLTIPPPITTTEQEEIATTTEFIEEPTTTEIPIETTTMDEELITTTELPPEEVTYPRFGKGVEFIYAMDEAKMEKESQRQAKKLPFDKEEDNVFVIMPQQFLEEEFKEEAATTAAPTTTSTTPAPPSLPEEPSQSETESPTDIPETTTIRPRIKKRIRVKVRKGFHLLQRLHPNDLFPEDAETTTLENTRINRNVEEPKRKINHSLYARKKHVLEMKNSIIPLTASTTETAPTTTTEPTTTSTSTATTELPSSSHQNPAILMLLNSNVAKRKSYFNRRLHVEPKAPASDPSPVQSSRKIDSDYHNQIEGQHQKMIEQVVARAIHQDSMMNTFDLADELLDPEMAVRIGNIQTMLAEEIMQRIFSRIGVQANLSSELEEPVSRTTTTTTTTVAPEPIVVEVESGDRPYRGSKRYIDTNFLNAYENVIHKVEEKIKSHKNHPNVRPRGRPTTQKSTEADVSSTTAQTRTPSTTVRPTANSSGNVQVLLNKRRRNKSRVGKLKTSTTSTTEASPLAATESSPEVEPITEIIKEIEKLHQEAESPSMVRDFKPSPLWEIYSDRGPDTEELAEPIDLLGRSARQLTTDQKAIEEGFVPIPNSQMTRSPQFVDSVPESSLQLPGVNRLIRFV